jgi:hypothetical protein
VHPARRSLLAINLVGGIAVLGSYAYGIASNPMTRGDVWGGVPDALRPLYTITMLLAAAGYFAFSYFVFFRLDPDATRVGGRFGFRVFHALYALILFPSAAWMPLTFAMLESPSGGLWWAIRIALAAVGVGSVGLLAAIVAVRAPAAVAARRVALIGCAAFCLQTAVLDAIVWPAFFPRSAPVEASSAILEGRDAATAASPAAAT